MNRNLLKNILAHYLGLFLMGAANLVVIPIFVHGLGHEGYGVLALGLSLIGLFHFLDFGIGTAAVKYIAEWKALSQQVKLYQLYSTALVLFFALGALAAGILFVLAPRVPEWFHVSASLSEDAEKAVILTAGGFLFYFPSIILKSFLEGAQRYDLSNAAEASMFILGAVISAALVLNGFGIVAVTLVNSLCYLYYLVFLSFLVRKEFPLLSLKWNMISGSSLKEIRDLSLWNFLRNVASRISWDLDSFIIGIFLSAKSVSPYVLGRKFPYVFSAVAWRWVTVFLPLASELDARGKQDTLRAIFLQGTRLCWALSLCGALILILLAEPILVLWLGEVSRETIIIQQLVTVSLILDLSHAVSATLLSGTGRLKRISLYFLLDSFLNLFLSLLLVRTLGIIGVALATAISSAVTVIFFHIPYACRIFYVTARQFLREVLLPQMIPGVTSASVMVLIEQNFDGAPLFRLLTIGLLGPALFLALFWFVSLSGAERRSVASWFKRAMAPDTVM